MERKAKRMLEEPTCPECKTPTHITSEHIWLTNGSIEQPGHPGNRIAFIETENFDPLFKGIEELIGTSIDHIVINVSRRMARAYMTEIIPEEARDVIRSGRVPPEITLEVAFRLTRILGMGLPTLLDLHLEHGDEDFIVIRYADPLSAPIMAGTLAGTVEAYLERQTGVTYEYVSPEVIDARAFPSKHPQELKYRLWATADSPREGQVELDRCPECGGPALLSNYHWDFDRGIIRDKSTGRRMAFVGPMIFDGVFQELESELGKDIPRIVVEAQRRFVRNGFYPASTIRDPDLNQELALRGLGDLTKLEVDQGGVNMTMNNSVLPLAVVGFMQGLFELAFGLESRAEWELSSHATLKAYITPWD
jgi:hypothetical protein